MSKPQRRCIVCLKVHIVTVCGWHDLPQRGRACDACFERLGEPGCVDAVNHRRKRVDHHGMSERPEFHAWLNIKQRCLTRSHPAYPDYGGRGITLAPEGADDFMAFYAAVGPRPQGAESKSRAAYSIGRIDNSKGYEPGNVRWALRKEQANNRRSVRALQARVDRLLAFIAANGLIAPNE